MVEATTRAASSARVERSTDEELLALVGRGDYDAFVELYGRYERMAYALACRVTRNPTLAEDATVEAFLGIWKNGARYDSSRGSARSWVLTVVHRRAVDCVRREQRHQREPEAVALPPEEADAPGAALLAEETRGRVESALSVLPPRERELIQLAYYDGYTQSEIAAKLMLPLGTVKSRMWTALARLRDALGPAAADAVGEADAAVAAAV